VKEGTIQFKRQEHVFAKLLGLQTQSIKERLGGLLVIERLKQSQCLWISPCNSIHTLAMRYSLDIIYLDKNDVVCGVKPNVKPWRMSFNIAAKSTLELSEGVIEVLGIQKGDQCQWHD
jgi:uncharacterized membrane protein (UPF0127 family)